MPALAAALNVTVPAPLREAGVVDEIVGMAFTVTVTNAVGSDVQARLFNVETVVRLYWVVAVKPDEGS